MNVLEIFGICFIIQITLIIYLVTFSIIKGFVDKKTKESTYKEMMQLDAALRKKAEEFNATKSSDPKNKTIENELKESKLDNTDPKLNSILEDAITGGLEDK